MSTSTNKSPFMRFASAVADFGDPFYAEERQRDVWNEASAFGFQLLLWGVFVVSAAMVWIGGRDALPFAASLVILTGLASWLTIGYAEKLGVEVTARRFRTRSRARLVVLGLVVAVLVLGLVRAGIEPEADSAAAGLDLSWSTVAGLITGAAVVLVPVLVFARLAHRRRQRAANGPDDGVADVQ